MWSEPAGEPDWRSHPRSGPAADRAGVPARVFHKERRQTVGELGIAVALPLLMYGFSALLSVPLSTIEANGAQAFLEGLYLFLRGVGVLAGLLIAVKALRSAGTTLRVDAAGLAWRGAGGKVDLRFEDVAHLALEARVEASNPVFTKGWRVDRYTFIRSDGGSVAIETPFHDEQGARDCIFRGLWRHVDAARATLEAGGEVDCGEVTLTREGLIPRPRVLDSVFIRQLAGEGGSPPASSRVPWSTLEAVALVGPGDLEEAARLAVRWRGGEVALQLDALRDPHVILALASEHTRIHRRGLTQAVVEDL